MATSGKKSGWVTNASGQKVYYNTNGTTDTGREYVQLPSLTDTTKGATGWYLLQDGVAQKGAQEWYGSEWYFDPSTYQLLKENTYRVENGQKVGYLVNSNGNVLSGVQKWMGTYYYFDPSTYLLLDHQDYVKSQWGDYYMVGSNGALMTGLVSWQGSKYYFDQSSYLLAKNTYSVPNGQKVGYLSGSDGKVLSGVQKWMGTYYYFDPSTNLLLDHQDYVKSHWGNYYMVGSNGALMSGLVKWQGTTYYFDPSSHLMVTNTTITVNGVQYKINASGAATVVNSMDAKVNKALGEIGVPYVWGGNSPSVGFDCSGLVQWAYGLSSSYRTTYQQQAIGTHVYSNVSSAPKGALLFFGSDSAPYHVAISLGDGSYVHAPTVGENVKIGYQKYFTPSYYIVLS
ncbi:NlpC/P60 family protein [Limosilactobacillus fermentum]|uniref:NlpC/P60 family protein n=3 Tax=Limosilactobacillus fermentum TaxID=1613 RepID=UPI0021CAFD8E|nr:NlpC/P60 family protein [Limosilactobacillus fermentum]